MTDSDRRRKAQEYFYPDGIPPQFYYCPSCGRCGKRGNIKHATTCSEPSELKISRNVEGEGNVLRDQNR